MNSLRRRLSRPKRNVAATRSVCASPSWRRVSKNGPDAARSASKGPRKNVDGVRNIMIYHDTCESEWSTAGAHTSRGPLFKLKVIHLICQECRMSQRMPPDHIDLSPLMTDPDAAEILMLARGQLNRAFRTHGLIPPDP